MQKLKYIIGGNKRALVKDVQNFKIDFNTADVHNFVQARQYENTMRQVFVDLVNDGDGSPYDLTGANIMFEGTLPDNTHKIMDAKHGVILDPQNGQFRFDFPKQAFAVAGSYTQAFFRIMRDGDSVTTLEFDLEVLADKVISGLIPADYITPFEDLYDQLEAIVASGNKKVDEAIAAWNAKFQAKYNEIAALSQDVANHLIEMRAQLDVIQDKIKSNDIATASQLKEELNKVRTDLMTEIGKRPTNQDVVDMLERGFANFDGGQPHAIDDEATLKKTYPSGHDGVFVTIDTGHKWMWGPQGAWIDGGPYQSMEVKDGSITAAKLVPNVLPLTFASPTPINFNFQKGRCEVPNGSVFLQNNQAFEIKQHSFDIDPETIGWIAFSKIDNQFKIDDVPTDDDAIVGYIWNGEAFLKCSNYNINGHVPAIISISKGVMGFVFSQNDLVVNNVTKQLKFSGQLIVKLQDGQEYTLKPVSQGGTQPDTIELTNNGNDTDWLSFDADAQKIIFGTKGDNIYRIGYSLNGGKEIYVNGIYSIIVDDGFNLAVLGDSITEGVNTSKTYHQFWDDFLRRDEIGAKIVNHGVGGTTVGDVGFNDDLASKSFVKRYPNIDNNTQMTIIFGGANDYNYGTELGEVDSTDPKTFCGALNTIIKGLLSKNPTMHIVGMTPMKTNYQDKNWDVTKNKQGLLIVDYVNAMIDVLHAHGLNCIDLYHNAGIDMTNPSVKQAISVDGLHPNAIGHDMIARYSYPFIKEYINHYTGPVIDNKYHN